MCAGGLVQAHNHVYGRGWPMCGEIDIVESRGNTPESCDGPGGYNAFGSALHWGPTPELNQYERCAGPTFPLWQNGIGGGTPKSPRLEVPSGRDPQIS